MMFVLALMVAVISLWTGPAMAQGAESAGISTAPAELTLMQMILKGGPILWLIMALGFVTIVMVVYYLLTVTTNREAPEKFAKRLRNHLLTHDVEGAYQLCEGRDELLAKVAKAGLKVAGHERFVIQEAMESEGERGATALWQKISYLNNIGVVAPLLGLLGTVWGMIGAFGAIALDDAQVKGLTMAYKVSEAMITTAAGLVLAIPAMVAYYYMRGRVIRIIAEVEAHATEIVELLSRSE